MNCYILNRGIFFKRSMLNFLLKFLSPTNELIVVLSQSLDKDISLRQRQLYNRYKKKARLRKKVYLKHIA